METECEMDVCDDEHVEGCDWLCVDDREVETECEMDVCDDEHVEGCVGCVWMIGRWRQRGRWTCVMMHTWKGVTGQVWKFVTRHSAMFVLVEDWLL